MLWRKAWLETRGRFLTGLILLSVLAAGSVYGYVATKQLLPMVDTTNVPPVAERAGLAGVIREAIEAQREFRGFIYFQAFRQNLMQLGVVFAVLLGCGGLLSEAKKGSALFTLSLPVTRRQLLGTRTALGLGQCLAITMIPPLVITLMAPVIRERFGVTDALAHGLCLFAVAALFYSLATFLSTLFGDIWRPLLIAFVLACAAVFVGFIAPEFSLFRVMSGETYFRSGTLPWTGLLTSAVLATALLYSAAETLERRDF